MLSEQKYSQHDDHIDSHELGAEIDKHIQYIRALSRHPRKAAFLNSIFDTIFSAIEQCPTDKLPEQSTSGIQKLVKLLEETEAQRVIPAEEDPLEGAKLRGIAAREWLLNAEGGSMTVSQVEKVLGLSRQAIHKRCSKGKLIHLSTSKRGYLFPKWQFTDHDILPGLEEVLAAFDEDDPWMQASFMLSPNIWLDGASPLAMLRQGKISEVLVAAHASGEQGAA